MAKDGRREFQHDSEPQSCLVDELRSRVTTDEIAAVEHTVAIAVQENKLLKGKRAAEFMNPSADSATKGIARTFSLGRKARVAS